MIMTTIQKIIKIGSSKGVTLPAKQLKQLGVDTGDEIELVIRKKNTTTDRDAVRVANSLLDRYGEDFADLAGR